MDSALDDITRVLFAQMRGVDENKDLDTLSCPKCRDRLEAILLDVEKNVDDELTYQHIWWTCRGLKKKTCFFPLNMPSEVYWTKRSLEQMREGFLPLPNFHLLPNKYHYLYPCLFKDPTKNLLQISNISTISKDSTAKTKIKNFSLNLPENVLLNLPKTSQNIKKGLDSLKLYSSFGNSTEDSLILKKDSITYCDGNRRNVELFRDPDSALESNLSLRYCTDEFLSTINSEMSRKQLIKPHLAICQRQRIRMANLIDKLSNINNNSFEQSIPDTDLEYPNEFTKDKVFTTSNGVKKRRKRVFEADFNHSEALRLLNEGKRVQNLTMRLGLEETVQTDQLEDQQEPQPSSSNTLTNENSYFIMPEHSSNPIEINENYSDITNPNTLSSDFTTTLTNVTPSNPSESSTNNMSRRRKRRKSKSQNEKVPFNSFGDPELDNLIKRKYIELINSNDYGINTSNKKRSRNFSRKKKASKVIKNMETPMTTRMAVESSSQIRVVDEHGYAIDMPEFSMMEELDRPLDDEFSSYYDF